MRKSTNINNQSYIKIEKQSKGTDTEDHELDNILN